MAIDRQSLIEHKEHLEKVIEHAQRELDAVKVLLNGVSLRENGSSTEANARQEGSRLSLPALIRKTIREFPEDKFTANDVGKRIIEMGYRKESEWTSFRPTVSHELKKLADKGKLERIDVGNPGKPKFQYRKKDEQLLVQ